MSAAQGDDFSRAFAVGDRVRCKFGNKTRDGVLSEIRRNGILRFIVHFKDAPDLKHLGGTVSFSRYEIKPIVRRRAGRNPLTHTAARLKHDVITAQYRALFDWRD